MPLGSGRRGHPSRAGAGSYVTAGEGAWRSRTLGPFVLVDSLVSCPHSMSRPGPRVAFPACFQEGLAAGQGGAGPGLPAE